MLRTLSDSFKKMYFKNKLKFLELIFLSLFLAFLPSFEAPKNIFLTSYLIIALYRQSQMPALKWNAWDWVFLSLIFSSFLTALFPGISGGFEWKGFRGMLFWIAFGWTLSRSDYSFEEKKYLFIFSIILLMPPSLWALGEMFILHTKNTFELHSLGVVNHSAIYLCIMAGTSLAFFCSQLQTLKMKHIFGAGLIFIFIFGAVLITKSRGAFVIAVLLVFAIFLLSKLLLRTKAILLTIFTIFLITIFFIKPIAVIEKQIVSQNNNDFLSQRDKVWRAAFEISRLNPLLGIGGGNWNQVKIDQIKTLVESRGEIFNAEDFALQYHHPHNIYLSNLVDRGILGLIIFLNLMLIWLITLVSSYKKFNQDSKAMLFILGSFSAWTAIFGIGFVNTTFHHENALLALFFLGLHLSFLRQKRIG
jgi:O-antigen ligase